MNRVTRTILLLTAGHLLCLSGFEWSRLWAFFPGPFRWGTAPFVALAFLLALASLVEPKRRISVTAALLVVWCSVSGFILLVEGPQRALLVTALGFALAAGLFQGARRAWALLGVGLLALATLTGVGTGWISVLLLLAYLIESRRLVVADLNLSALEAIKDRRPGEAMAEISWRGFAQLYSACAKGEGEKFSRRVLSDTVEVVNSCGGKLQSGSEHRGVYRFPSYAARRECHRVLLEYQEQLDGVLEEVKAPLIRVFFREL